MIAKYPANSTVPTKEQKAPHLAVACDAGLSNTNPKRQRSSSDEEDENG
jgi:hypothetical protein